MMHLKREGLELLVRETVPTPLASCWGDEAAARALGFHQSLVAYRETPLVSLPALAASLGLGGIYVKDESARFGLKAFKGLGGSYALHGILQETGEKSPVFVTATDGNHGKGVAWAARLFGCPAHIYMPAGSSEARRQAILDAGAETVVITDKNYDDTVELARCLAEEKGWILIQDTAWPGYEEIPGRIIEGYLTLAAEAAAVLDREKIVPTHVFLQAGVGSMAGGIMAYLRQHYGPGLKAVTVEPKEAACLFESFKAGDGLAHTVGGHPQTIMAGLNCGTPCSLVWPVLRDQSLGMAAVSDAVTMAGMGRYARPLGEDQPIVAGESGAVTLGFLLEAAGDANWRQALQLNRDSHILLVNTEGDTDPAMYQQIIAGC